MRHLSLVGGLLAAALALAGSARAAGDAAAGQAIFERICRNCHSAEIGVNKVGPSLHHLLGRPAGTVPDYPYSPALKASGKVWTAAELDLYLADPAGTVPGVKMHFKGFGAATDRADVIAYLQSLE